MALVTQKAGAGQNPFHSTPAGNNSVPGVEGFTASARLRGTAPWLGQY